MSSVMRFDEWQDSNGVAVASGAGGVFTSPGSILQVVSTVKTNTFTSNSLSYEDITDFSVSITPSSTSSKILVLAQLTVSTSSSGDQTIHAQLVRDSTAISIGDASDSRVRNSFSVFGRAGDGETGTNSNLSASITHLDSPNTTSAITYKVQVRKVADAVFVNRNGDDSDIARSGRGASNITVMEVAG